MGAEQDCAGSHGSAQRARPPLELADIVREYREAYAEKYGLTLTESSVLDAVERCRTAALGGHVDVCLACGHERPSYNSCLMESARFWGAQRWIGVRQGASRSFNSPLPWGLEPGEQRVSRSK